MAKALYGYLAAPSAASHTQARLISEITRLRCELAALRAENEALRAGFIAPDDLAVLDDLDALELLDPSLPTDPESEWETARDGERDGVDPAYA